MAYMDAFVCAVPQDKVEDYKAVVRQTVPLWKEYGALQYVEAAADDVPYGQLTSFPRAVQAKENEVVHVAFVLFPDKATRDRAGEAMGTDPRFQALMEQFGTMADMSLMIYGGFSPIVEA